jgi:2-polyprenyl-3-methyl-5-hydroxy-6-metoxy-1,4-benzoquinol methylase
MAICNLCGKEDHRHLFMKGSWDIVKCENCGLIFVKNPPKSSELESEIYSKDYFESHVARVKKAVNDSIFENIFERRYKLISQKSRPNKGKMLEIGCGIGTFLEIAKNDDWHTYGIDISEQSCNYAREHDLEVYQGDFCYMDNFIKEYEDYFDIITMWACIEHMRDPKRALLNANRCLKDNGTIVISTGDIESIDAKISGIKWDLLTPPDHLYYFSQKTLTKLLEETGFQVIKLWHKEGNVISDEIFGKIIANKYLNYFLARFNLGDIMIVFAKKKKRSHKLEE